MKKPSTIVLRTYNKGISEYKKYLMDCNIDFKVKTTTNSCSIDYEDLDGKKKVMFCDGLYLSIKEMILQKKLKKHIKKRNNGKKVNYQNQKINYWRFDNSLHSMVESSGECVEFHNILEMDITKAYYKMARNLDYISEEIYQICLKLPKPIRLRLIGSIATHKVIETYENKEIKNIQIIEDDELRQIWFHICYEVGAVMQECADAIQDYFIFYWVDGIYFQRDKRFLSKNDPSQQIIKNIFQKNNLDFSVSKLNKISLQNYNEHLTLKCYKENKVKSHFSVPYNKVKMYVDDKVFV